MNSVEIILGKDFLINNGIVIDFGKGIFYSDQTIFEQEKIVEPNDVKSILKSKCQIKSKTINNKKNRI